jgi:hypothetical protein
MVAGAITPDSMNCTSTQFRRVNNNDGRTKLWPNSELDLTTTRLHAFEGLGQIR